MTMHSQLNQAAGEKAWAMVCAPALGSVYFSRVHGSRKPPIGSLCVQIKNEPRFSEDGHQKQDPSDKVSDTEAGSDSDAGK